MKIVVFHRSLCRWICRRWDS